VILYTCPARTHGATAPLVQHPCGLAAKALDDAGLEYELEIVGGFKRLPFSRRGRRDVIRELSGQEDVPILVVDGETVITGTRAIIDWAHAHAGTAAG
jgi:glutathione S-transferase